MYVCMYVCMYVAWSVYHVVAFSDFELLKSDAECHSDDTHLGSFDTLAGCANACHQRFRLKHNLRSLRAFLQNVVVDSTYLNSYRNTFLPKKDVPL